MSIVKDEMQRCITSIDERGGHNDFMGLVTFSRAAKIDVPFSRDRSFLIEMIKKIVPETLDRLNGTSIGYAIFKSVSLIVACRSFAGKEDGNDTGAPLIGNAIVLVTDGLEEPNPADRSDPFRSIRTLQALDYARENHVKVNYVNVDRHSYQQLSSEERDRLLNAVEATGGQYFEITFSQSLGQVMSQIAESAQRQQAPSRKEDGRELGFWLIVIALTCVSFSRLLETVFMRVAR
jgi:Ca-activated chloride channel family protein